MSAQGATRALRAVEAPSFNLWVMVKPAPDVAGEWIAHCLELDVVTQGRSIKHAFAMAAEASVEVLKSDLDAGREPSDRRAPDEYWRSLWKLLGSATVVNLTEAEKTPKRFRCFAAQLVVQAVKLNARPPTSSSRRAKRSRTQAYEVPAMWGRASAAAASA